MFVCLKHLDVCEATRGTGEQSVPVNRLIVDSIPTGEDEIFIYIYIFISSLCCRGESVALSHAMPLEIGGKCGTECLNTRFPLPTLLRAGYSVKLIIQVCLHYLTLTILYYKR